MNVIAFRADMERAAAVAAEAPSPVDNGVFHPARDADVAPAFCGTIRIAQTYMHTTPELQHPVVIERDARLFPGITLSLFTMGDGILVPMERGRMIEESAVSETPSYWCVIPQLGRVWCERGDGGWSRAALPVMLVSDTENHAHQGLVTFLYRQGAVSELRFQFVQQTAPYLLKQHFIAWGCARAEILGPCPVDLDSSRALARAELARRLPARPWSDLMAELAPGTLDGFGGPLRSKWRVQGGLVRNGVLYYQDVQTPLGLYPYPLEMRFGVRSIMKSVAAPLALLRLAQTYGPYVLTLRIGDYVPGLDSKYRRVRFLDAANMASGFGGVGTWKTNPNDVHDGYLDGHYDTWYTARSHAEKMRRIAEDLRPYPWEPGTVMRYRDQDFYLLGAAIQGFLKTVRGPAADVWHMLKLEVFAPIGIAHAPAVRTREPDGCGLVWFNAGYYPTLDDLAKIGLLYQNLGAWEGQQILHRGLTEELLAARDAVAKDGDTSTGRHACVPAAGPGGLYKMGFHFSAHAGSASRKRFWLPTMSGSGESEVILFPNRLISIRIGKAAQLPPREDAFASDGVTTAHAVDRLDPF